MGKLRYMCAIFALACGISGACASTASAAPSRTLVATTFTAPSLLPPEPNDDPDPGCSQNYPVRLTASGYLGEFMVVCASSRGYVSVTNRTGDLSVFVGVSDSTGRWTPRLYSPPPSSYLAYAIHGVDYAGCSASYCTAGPGDTIEAGVSFPFSVTMRVAIPASLAIVATGIMMSWAEEHLDPGRALAQEAVECGEDARSLFLDRNDQDAIRDAIHGAFGCHSFESSLRRELDLDAGDATVADRALSFGDRFTTRLREGLQDIAKIVEHDH